jgi:two-component system sensor histidine kinase ChiS
MVLEGAAYHVRTAPNGAEALQMIAEERPDLVILDVMMPGMSGIEMAKRLAGDPGTQDLPVILLTAVDERSEPALRHQAQARKVYVLQKPFHRQQFLDKVGEALKS